ncbi:SGNH/GDSL hydrolase family protein [Streptomyces sp. KM273126]|uniref:SGNH/GDSL hydrolase family protein n=1 Tax=Streptomyces sp. KM273126 TaxID=2545247 RepID=UPI002678DAF9|nr:SGNH/GDSL hydrolase family protein [Streptomyces sp. KM273126]
MFARMPRRTPGTLFALTAALLTGLLALLATHPSTAAPPGSGGAWTGTWASGVSGVPASADTVFTDQTVRQIVHTSVPGHRVRVRLTNEYGTKPLVVGEARLALGADGPTGTEIVPDSDRVLRFGGRPSVTLAPGERRWSDPVALRTPAVADLVVSFHLPHRTRATTVHSSAFERTYVAAGNVTSKPSVEPTATTASWYFLSGVSVTGGAARSSLVAFGDSITDGAVTETGANHRWPDLLAERLRQDPALARIGVLNTGIGGNRLLHDPNPPAGNPAETFAAYFGEAGLKRFDRDVTSQPGARYAIVLIGVNDLGHPGNIAPADEEVTAADLIAGYRKLIQRAHAHGLKIFGATILPFEGDTLNFYTPEREAARQTVNQWIRTSGAYDGVVDFDAAVRDPEHPGRLLPAYDSGDHLHPNDAGMAAMARAVPLHLFR